jgi:hypothetical protein
MVATKKCQATYSLSTEIDEPGRAKMTSYFSNKFELAGVLDFFFGSPNPRQIHY